MISSCLRGLARRSRDPDQIRRLLALAATYDGGSRSEAAAIGGVGLQTVRDWVLRLNRDGPTGLANGKAPGEAALLDDAPRPLLRGLEQARRSTLDHYVHRTAPMVGSD